MAVKVVKEKVEYPEYIEKHYLYCDKCGSLMYQGMVVLTSYPVQYIYFCPECGHGETSFTLYANRMQSYDEWYRTKHKDN